MRCAPTGAETPSPEIVDDAAKSLGLSTSGAGVVIGVATASYGPEFRSEMWGAAPIPAPPIRRSAFGCQLLLVRSGSFARLSGPTGLRARQACCRPVDVAQWRIRIDLDLETQHSSGDFPHMWSVYWICKRPRVLPDQTATGTRLRATHTPIPLHCKRHPLCGCGTCRLLCPGSGA